METPFLVVGDGNGNFTEVPELNMAGVNFVKPLLPRAEDLIPLPPQARLAALPGRNAIGYDADLEKFIPLREYGGMRVFPAAAMLPDTCLQLLRSAFSMVLDSPRLPNENFTAVGRLEDRYVVAATPLRQPLFPGQQIFAISPGDVAASETISAAALHLNSVPHGLVRFEINHLEQLPLAAEMIGKIRSQTDKGAVHLTAGVFHPRRIKECCRAGLDGLEAITHSAREEYYEKFADLSFGTLRESLQAVSQAGRRTILRYRVFPGLTDHPLEFDALKKLLSETGVEWIRPVNLNVDPEWYMDRLMLWTLPRTQVGMRKWRETIAEKFPHIRVGY